MINILANVGNAGYALPMVQAYPEDQVNASILQWNPIKKALEYVSFANLEALATEATEAVTYINQLIDASAVPLTSFAQLRDPTYTRNADTFYISTDGISGWFKRRLSGTAVDDGGMTIVDTLGAIFDRLTDGNGIYIKWFGAKGDGVTDDTVNVQKAVDYCVVTGETLRDDAAATYLVGPINWNGTGTPKPANQQWACLKGFKGAGRRSTIFKAKPGAYPSNEWVIQGNNSSGVSYSDFGVDAAGVTTRGMDLSWIGGSEGNPVLAPSNNNVLENVTVEGASGFSLNLDQFHDSKISGVWVRGATAGNIGISLQGAGGQFVMSQCYASTGKFRIACQNAGISDCGFFQGVELSLSGYNNISFTGGHYYPDPTTGIIINSTATGNATRGVKFVGGYFNGATNVIAGRYWQGVQFETCQFNGYSGGFFGAITPAAGGGYPPIFGFKSCGFEGATPTTVPGQAIVDIEATRTSIGTVIGLRYLGQQAEAQTVYATSKLFAGLPTSFADSTAGFACNGGWLKSLSNVAGINPATGSGPMLGWNYSGGEGESVIGYNNGGGPVGGLRFVDTSGGGYSIRAALGSTTFQPWTDNTMALGNPSARWSVVYAATGTINTSDKNYKEQISDIDEKIFKAWSKVKYSKFKFKDSVVEKGESARWHFGLLAQEVKAAFESEGLDAFAYGLLCYDSWEAQEAMTVEVDGKMVVTQEAKPAGERYGIRYEEALALEAAYLRWIIESKQ